MSTKTREIDHTPVSESFNHADLTDAEKKERGIETADEEKTRLEKAKAVKKEAKPKAKKEAKPKAKKEAKPKAKKEAKPKAKKESERGYVHHKGTEADPLTGQSAPRLKNIESKDDLNEKEQLVLTTLNRARGPLSLADIAERSFSGRCVTERGTSWARNSLRRLVREKWVKKVDRGMYEAA